MASILELPTRTDNRGSLTVLEKVLPFELKRIYWIYDLNNESRGKHRHKVTWQAMVCLQGKCEVIVKKYQQEECFLLEKPNEILILEPDDWHEMKSFEQSPILLVVASHFYDANDYIKEPL